MFRKRKPEPQVRQAAKAVILAADGQAVSVTSDLLTVRRSHVIGDTVTLTILRDGQQFDVEVTLRSNRSFG